ncbi:hypothetical protein FRC08_001763 [Ceratobasidium sp. 394]|nr:hypothetical protein FRC08_001763 [Ceratobasidium sp. 394]KAG9091567.1 hypothetical protein FS749_016439 [Ceratobasidium sp. UAMH 11750]
MRMTLVPPVLPPFLASTYDLKPVEDPPSDGEVKMVHAVMRALDDVANVPALYDADLAMRLSMHLFGIQMARYRTKHPYIIFPSNETHAPPPLPAHIPVELEPVTGPPSDSQLKSVQTALRISESMVNVPSMFDADLSMQLSQHLFNIQFERYLREVADGGPLTSVTSPRAGINATNSDSAGPSRVQHDPMERNREQDDHEVSTVEMDASSSIQGPTELHFRDPTPQPSPGFRSRLESFEPIQSKPRHTFAELPKEPEDTTRVLAEGLRHAQPPDDKMEDAQELTFPAATKPASPNLPPEKSTIGFSMIAPTASSEVTNTEPRKTPSMPPLEPLAFTPLSTTSSNGIPLSSFFGNTKRHKDRRVDTNPYAALSRLGNSPTKKEQLDMKAQAGFTSFGGGSKVKNRMKGKGT